MKRFALVTILISSLLTGTYAQEFHSECKSQGKNILRKVEKRIQKETRRLRKGTTYFNGPGSGYQITHSTSLDTITNMVKRMACVKDAVWDKCQTKCAIYPGHATLGIRIVAGDQIVEKCFHFQLGSTGVIKIFGWRPHLLKTKDILIYKGMKDCPGFVDRQSTLCKGIVK